MNWISSILILLAAATSFSAPHPMTGSAYIHQVSSGAIFTQLGFRVHNIPPNWQLKKPMDAEAQVVEIGPEQSQSKTLLSFRMDEVPLKTELEKYVRQYLRDYNQYGFEVIGLQSLKQPSLNSIVVDLNQKNKKTRSRQVFYKKDSKIVTATCIDNFDQFNKTILVCNSVLETFQWR